MGTGILKEEGQRKKERGAERVREEREEHKKRAGGEYDESRSAATSC